MHCPDCKTELHCGCKACQINYPNLPNKMIQQPDGECESCPNCGLTQHGNAWLEEEARQTRNKIRVVQGDN